MLIKSNQIELNLRRTAKKGYISLLNQENLENLAFKYFGITDEKGNIIGYQCPYSGQIFEDYSNLVLEHIIPIDSKGGTVLFNCIPTSSEVNKTNEKGAKHLITWWTNSKYWDINAIERLEKLVNYMLEAYDMVFEEYTLEELENSYLDFELSEDIDLVDSLEFSEEQESLILKQQGEQNGIHSYLGFILSCIETLEKYNINTIQIRNKLKDLENKNIFENIDRFQLFQNVLQKIIVSRLGDDNRSYLTYLLKFDIKKIMDSTEFQTEDDIYNEINLRLKNIENILKENNLSIIDYFKNADDITDIDIIYKNINNITEEDQSLFLENISLGFDSKMIIFINMLNDGNSNILKVENNETLKGYPNIKLAKFWSRNKIKIMQKLFEELKDNPEYEVARKIVTEWLVENDIDMRINIFINMLNEGNSNILKKENSEVLKEYPNIKLDQFWTHNKTIIMTKLFEELKDNPEYEIARKIVNDWQVENDIDTRINIFINMLNEGNSNILKTKNNETLKGYPKIKLNQFWSNNKTIIMTKLFGELKDNSEYEVARKIVNEWLVENDIDKKITIFINMLNEGNSNILKKKNNEILKGYPNIKLDNFWSRNKTIIMTKLFGELKDNSEYEVARKIVNEWLVENDIDKKITIFINMLNEGNSNILKKKNNEILKGYPNIKLDNFWITNKTIIMTKLFEELKDNPEYEVARKIVNEWLVDNDIDMKINIFINMLNGGNRNILKSVNDETLKGYPKIKLNQFWSNNKAIIMTKLFEELKDNPEYEVARKIVKEWLIENDIDTRINIFINMLNEGNSNILKQGNKETLKGYPNIKLDNFWSHQKNMIMTKLFEELKDNPEYEVARKTVLTYLKVNSYDEYLEKEIKKQELKELKKIKKQQEAVIEYLDEKENIRKRA